MPSLAGRYRLGGRSLMSIARLIFALLFLLSTVTIAGQNTNLGKPASAELIQAWNQDIFIDGNGLPAGQGNALAGETVYRQYCINCHGLEGSGGSAEELAGAMHTLTDNPPDKTIGTYWPYATTLFDFIRRSMPMDRPGVLDNNELYEVTAYLLFLNGIIPRDRLINAETLSIIKMPNRMGFINVYKKEWKND